MTKRKVPETAVSKSSGFEADSNRSVETANNTSAAEMQLRLWEHAVQLFTQRNFEEACAEFREVAAGPAAHIADKARSYLQICERKTAHPELSLRTVEDHFTCGVERLNAGDTAQARSHFAQALELQPDSDHILYTMALCCGMSGDGNGACENLKRAIGIDPTNRILARQDPEFLPLFAQIPALRALVSNDGY